MKKEDILELARTRMAEAVNADRDNRLEDMDDLKKLTGDQWPEEIRAEREAELKPCLTLNRLPQFVRQVTGDIRRMNPAINIIPADNDASEDVAELIEGLIRHIEYRSDASSVYEQTAEQAAASSIGCFRVMNDWEDDDSFNQEILIKRIRNPFSVYWDPAAELPTREDAGYVFITEQMKRTDFEKEYKGKTVSDAAHEATTDGRENWFEGDKVIIAEYYWKEPVEKTIYLMADGSVTDTAQIPENIVRKRKVNTHKIMWAKISGSDVLEGPQDVVGKMLPVVAITGEEWHVGDRVKRSSVIRYAKDAQQMYNYWRSASTELVALQPKAPYIVTAKQIDGLEALWAAANSANRPYLVYNPDDRAPGRPQRETPPVSSAGMMNEIMGAAEDMKATTGVYDAALGNRSNEQSGVAIRQRQMESDVSTSIYADNMAKAIATCGRIIVGMIPLVYDTARVLRIIGQDDQVQQVPVNGVRQSLDGIERINDLTVGKYDVRVNVGPNYSTRRQETAEGMLEFIRVFPPAAAVTADLVAKSMDWPDADKFADRLKKTLPPGVRDLEDMSLEERQTAQQGMAQQAQQAQFAQAMQQTEATKAQAEAIEAQADAEKARLEAQEQGLELAMKSGQLNAAIGQLIQQEVARALQGVFAPRGF